MSAFRYNRSTDRFDSATESLTRQEFAARMRALFAETLAASPQPARAERRQAVQLHFEAEVRRQRISNGRSGIVRATKGRR